MPICCALATRRKRGSSAPSRRSASRGLERAVGALKETGFRNDDISALFPDDALAARAERELADGEGFVVGGILGWVTGVGALSIPEFGAFIAAGPVMSSLVACGRLTSALIQLGLSDYDAARYERLVGQGGLLVSVHSEDRQWNARALRCLAASGAREISSSSELAPPAPATADKRVA